MDPSLGPAIVREATRLGINPADLATVIGYETIGTYNPDIRGGAGNAYRGLIQFGPHEQRVYGITPGMSADEQMIKVGNYLQDRGLQPGMNILDLYSTINAGSPGHYGWRDASGKTVAQHVAEMQRTYGQEAAQLVANVTGVDQAPAQTPASTGVPIAPGYVVPPETAASYFAAQRTSPLSSGTLTSQDINADPNSRLSYAEQRDAFAQRYAGIPWSALHPQEQAALTEHFGSSAPTKYEAMRQSLTPTFAGSGDTNLLAGSMRAPDPLDVVQPPQGYVRPFGLDDPAAYHVGAGIMPQAQVGGGQPLSPYVRGDFFGSPPVTPPTSIHSTPQMSYAPASYAAIQPYSTQPPAQPLPHPGQGMGGFTQADTGGAVQHVAGPDQLPIAPSDAPPSPAQMAMQGIPGEPAQMPAAAPTATGGVGGFLHQIVQAAAPIVHQVVQTVQTGVMPGGQSLGGFLSGISSFGGGPLPGGVSDQSGFSSFLQHQNWEGPGTSHAGTAFSPGSGGATYQYFTPSQPGGIGGYVVPAGHPNAGTVYTYNTSPGVQANP